MENPDLVFYTPTPFQTIYPIPWEKPRQAVIEGDSSGEKELEAARTLKRLQSLAAQDAAIQEIDDDLNLTEKEIQERVKRDSLQRTSSRG